MRVLFLFPTLLIFNPTIVDASFQATRIRGTTDWVVYVSRNTKVADIIGTHPGLSFGNNSSYKGLQISKALNQFLSVSNDGTLTVKNSKLLINKLESADDKSIYGTVTILFKHFFLQTNVSIHLVSTVADVDMIVRRRCHLFRDRRIAVHKKRFKLADDYPGKDKDLASAISNTQILFETQMSQWKLNRSRFLSQSKGDADLFISLSTQYFMKFQKKYSLDPSSDFQHISKLPK